MKIKYKNVSMNKNHILLCLFIILLNYAEQNAMNKYNFDSIYTYFSWEEIEIITGRAPKPRPTPPQHTLSKRLIQSNREIRQRLNTLEPDRITSNETAQEYYMLKKTLEDNQHTLSQMNTREELMELGYISD